MCFGMGCRYERSDGECRLRRGRPTVYPEDAACVYPETTEEGVGPNVRTNSPVGVIELDPNTE